MHGGSNICAGAGGLDSSDIFNDNDNNNLLSGSGLKKTVLGMIMEAEVDYKKKKSNGYEEMNGKVKDWMPPHVMMDFTDHKKQKHLVMVVVLPTPT